MDGALILDKPAGISSHSAVLKVRRLLSEPRIGHLGTLDPFATGVLVLLLGQATRLARFYRDRDKTYEGTIRFGFSTDSYDRTGKPDSPERETNLDAGEIGRVLGEFLGTRLQQPPPFSAKKVGGVRAYELARKGKDPHLQAVAVTIHELEMLSLAGPLLRFRTRVSPGTYIRSLAHELGERLGPGAHLEQLRRTAAGEFTENEALRFEQLEERSRNGAVPLIPMERLLPDIPVAVLPPEALAPVSHGNSVAVDCSAEWVRLFDQSGSLAAIAEHIGEGLCHPIVVFGSEHG
jgi:tRNA pseudouridine55 synthase